MKNHLICGSCGNENPIFNLTCLNCKAFLRERVVNIDLFNLLYNLIDQPVNAFRRVIFAEHKNFIFLLLLLAALKLLIDTFFISILTIGNQEVFRNSFRNYAVFSAALVLILLLNSYLLKAAAQFTKGGVTRIKDNFSIFIYSLTPHIFALIFLFPVELVLFGGYLFSDNPSPFILKESLAWIMLIVEALMILWSIFLSGAAAYTQTRGAAGTILITIIFNLSLFFLLFLASIYLYIF